MKTRALLVASLFAMSFAHSLTVQAAEIKGRVECQESGMNESEDDGESVDLAKINVTLDEAGNANSVSLVRPASDDLPELKLLWDLNNSKITHTIESKEPDAYEITEYEAVKATAQDGTSIQLNLNDHKYAGIPGSSFNLTVNGKKLSTEYVGHMVFCEGQFKLDVARPPALDDLAE